MMNIESNPLDQSDSGLSDLEEPANAVHDWEELSKPYYAIPGVSAPQVEGVHYVADTTGDSDSIEDKPLLDSHQDPTALDYAKPMSLLSWLYSYLPTVDKSSWSEFMSSMARNWLAYLIEILDCVAQMMKGPITYFVFCWMLVIVTKKATPILWQALPPVCSLPGTSILQTCRSEPLGTASTISQGLRSMDFPKIFDIQKKAFDHLTDQSASLGGSGLSLDLKRVEMASKDLVTLIKVSDMKSRDDIARTMNMFVRNAQVTGRGLSKFNAKIGGAMDSIEAVSNHALRTIEEAHTIAASASVFPLMPWSTKRDTQAMIATAFTQTMEVLSNNLRQLILEAETSHSNLEALEQNLSVLHEIVLREDSSINSAKAELLSDLWTKLRFRNRQQVRQHDENLALLTDVAKYRKKALALVVSSLYTLRELSEDIENLRERVAEPNLIGTQVPVMVHIESIKAGLGRLQQGRTKSKERGDYVVKRIMSDA